jgi:hypothetical protein
MDEPSQGCLRSQKVLGWLLNCNCFANSIDRADASSNYSKHKMAKCTFNNTYAYHGCPILATNIRYVDISQRIGLRRLGQYTDAEILDLPYDLPLIAGQHSAMRPHSSRHPLRIFLLRDVMVFKPRDSKNLQMRDLNEGLTLLHKRVRMLVIGVEGQKDYSTGKCDNWVPLRDTMSSDKDKVANLTRAAENNVLRPEEMIRSWSLLCPFSKLSILVCTGFCAAFSSAGKGSIFNDLKLKHLYIHIRNH